MISKKWFIQSKRRILAVLAALFVAQMAVMPAYGIIYTALTLPGTNWEAVGQRVEANWRDFATDWKSPTGLLEVGAPYISSLFNDACLAAAWIKGKEVPVYAPTVVSSAVNVALQSRMFLEPYQEYRFGKQDEVSDWLQRDVRLALNIWGGMQEKESRKIPIKRLRRVGYDVYGQISQTWLGIVPTNAAIFVDEEFLAQARINPLLYGFLLAYGISLKNRNVFEKREIASMANSLIGSFAVGYITNAVQSGVHKAAGSVVNGAAGLVERKLPSLAIWQHWNCIKALTDKAGDAQRGWLSWLMLKGVARPTIAVGSFFMKIQEFIMLSNIVGNGYNFVANKALSAWFGYTCHVDKNIFGQKMRVWLSLFDSSEGLSETDKVKQAELLEKQKVLSHKGRLSSIKGYIKYWIAKEQEKAPEKQNPLRLLLLSYIESDINHYGSVVHKQEGQKPQAVPQPQQAPDEPQEQKKQEAQDAPQDQAVQPNAPQAPVAPSKSSVAQQQEEVRRLPKDDEIIRDINNSKVVRSCGSSLKLQEAPAIQQQQIPGPLLQGNRII